ncbi:MAG: DUF192 domain-containing protein [Nanoarchaeota archaeon]|nr:DUF192 domain-containing protein [Nanoarchaeota archaeon]
MIKNGKKILITKTTTLTTTYQQFLGLRGKTISKQEAYIFPLTTTSRFLAIVDMFFMKEPLLILWLANNKIVDIQQAQPWNIYLPQQAANKIIEVHPANKNKFKKGQQLTIT